MGYGISLHIGLNRVDPRHYNGWAGPLNACEADANSMQRICTGQGFDAEVLKTAAATRGAVLGKLQDLADRLHSGDTLVVSYSGHGGQLPDLNGDEGDSLDETWCLFDGELLDDELHRCWAAFRAGVRIAVFSDSCHSGTVIRAIRSENRAEPQEKIEEMVAGYRVAPPEVQRETYLANREFYDGLLAKPLPPAPTCSVALVSGCKDDQLSKDGTFNGAFTGGLLRVWKNGAFQGGYAALASAVDDELKDRSQTPSFMAVGAPDPSFYNSRVFTP